MFGRSGDVGGEAVDDLAKTGRIYLLGLQRFAVGLEGCMEVGVSPDWTDGGSCNPAF